MAANLVYGREKCPLCFRKEIENLQLHCKSRGLADEVEQLKNHVDRQQRIILVLEEEIKLMQHTIRSMKSSDTIDLFY